MLPVTMTAAAQPRSTTCCCQDLARGRLLPPGKLKLMPAGMMKPNSMMTGTGPFAASGQVTCAWMRTSMDGQAELSATPARSRRMHGMPSMSIFSSFTTSHLMAGTFSGTRP